MGRPALDQLHAMVGQHPEQYRNHVLDAVERQWDRLYPGVADKNPDLADYSKLRIALGILNGQDQHGDGPHADFHREADNSASDFLDMVEHGRQDNYPHDDTTGEPLEANELSRAQRALNAGNPGPGWNFSDWNRLSPEDQQKKLSPGEYWDWQHGRDIDFMRDMHRAPSTALVDAKPISAQVAAHSLWAPEWEPSEGQTATSDVAALLAHQKRQNAVSNFTRSEGKERHSENLLYSNYPQAGIGHMEGNSPEGLFNAIGNTDNPVGGVFNMFDTTVPGVQGAVQGEENPWQRGVLLASMNGYLNRHSPVIPDTVNTPAARHRVKAEMEGIRDDLRPIPTADSQFLQTGMPQTNAASMGKELLYNTGDLSTFASGGLGAAADATKGIRSLLRGLSGESLGEFAWGLPFMAPPTAVHAAKGTLFSPDFGEHGKTKDSLTDIQGNVHNYSRPLNDEERGATLEELRKAQESARKQASGLFAPGGGYQKFGPLHRPGGPNPLPPANAPVRR